MLDDAIDVDAIDHQFREVHLIQGLLHHPVQVNSIEDHPGEVKPIEHEGEGTGHHSIQGLVHRTRHCTVDGHRDRRRRPADSRQQRLQRTGILLGTLRQDDDEFGASWHGPIMGHVSA